MPQVGQRRGGKIGESSMAALIIPFELQAWDAPSKVRFAMDSPVEHDLWDVLDEEDALLTQRLEDMVESGE